MRIWKCFVPRTEARTIRGTISVAAGILLAVGAVLLSNGARADDGGGQPNANDEVVAVSLATSSWQTPSISPNICTNAQDVYKSAKFTASVQPNGSTAAVSVSSGAVTVSPATVHNGDTVTVTAQAGAAKGPYVLSIVSNQDSTISNTAGGTLFILKEQNLNLTHSSSLYDVDASSLRVNRLVKFTTSAPSTFSIETGVQLYYGDPNTATATGTATMTYEIVSDPNVYSGGAQCPTTISATDHGHLECGGSYSVEIAGVNIGGSHSDMTSDMSIAVSGLKAGNQTMSRLQQVAHAPNVLLNPLGWTAWGSSIAYFVPDLPTNYNNDTTQYYVGSTVTVDFTYTMSGTRGGVPGAVYLTSYVDGDATCTGTAFTTGAFTLVP